MSPRADGRRGAQPPGEIPGLTFDVRPEVHVHQPLPRMVWTDSDESTIRLATGLPSRDAFVELLRRVERDEEFRADVFRLSAKRRGIETERLVLFLRARHGGKSADHAAQDDAPASGVDRVLAEAGMERVPAARARRGAR